MAVIATLSGTALRPGISKNRRYYSPDLIARMVERANERMTDESGRPLTMRTGHPDPESQQFAPVTATAGRVTGLRVAEDGSARFTAELYDSQAGRDVLALYDTRGQRPAVRNVSIRGRWLGDVVGLMVDGVQCEGADDLELDGLDFTHLPGVEGAQVDRVAAPGAALEAAGAVGGLIFESLEETSVTVTETAAAPAPHADLGYLADGQRRWPLGTLAEARESWIAIHESKNAERYTAGQIKRLRGRTAKALRGFGVEVRRDLGESAGPVLVSRGQVAEGAFFDGEYTRPGEFYVRLDNGAVCITVSSCSIDPHDLGRVGTAAMGGAVQALLAMDPDDDGDIDVAGAPYQDTDHGMEATPAGAAPAVEGVTPRGLPDADDDDDDTEGAATAGAPATETATGTPPAPADQTPASTAEAANTTESEAPVMTDATQAAAAEATPAPTTPAPAAAAAPLTIEALTAFGTAMGEALAAKLAPAAPAAAAVEAAPAAVETPAVETPAVPAVAETEDERISRLVEAKLAERSAALEADNKAFLQTEIRAGRITPSRKGLVGRVTEAGEMQPVGGDVAEGLNEHGLPVKLAGNKAPHELVGAQRAGLSALLFEHYTNPQGR